MAVYTIPSDTEIVNIHRPQGQALDITLVRPDTDWSGTYVGQIVTSGTIPTLVAALTVTMTFDGTNTAISITANKATMAAIASGSYRWGIRRTSDGLYPLQGALEIQPAPVPVS